MHASKMTQRERVHKRERDKSYSSRVTAEEPGGVLGVGRVPLAVKEGRGLDSRGEQRGQARCESGGKAGS